MKKILSVLLLVGALNANADCENAYETKARKRQKSNRITATIVTHVLFPPSILGFGHIYSDSSFSNNTFSKSLKIIKWAKENKVHPYLLKKMEKELALSAHTDIVIDEMKNYAINIVLKSNNSQEICKIEDGKINVLNHRRLSKLVIEKLRSY